MESGSLIQEVLVTFECAFVTFLLFTLYFKQKINDIELIFYAFGCSTFFVAFISDTITPMFFVTTYFAISEAVLFFKGKISFRPSLLFVLLLPLLSSVVIAVLIVLGFDIFDGFNPSVIRVFYDALFFYVKYLLPFIFLGVRIYRKSNLYNIEYFFSIIKRIALISCCIGLFQFFLSFVVKDLTVLRLFGLRPNYVAFTANGLDSASARISAFFVEPKALSSFLVISFPLFLRDKKLIPIVLVLVVGLLTASQTFIVGIVAACILFFLIKRITNIRPNIAIGLFIILCAFLSVSILKIVFFNFYMSHTDNYVVNLVLARAVERYDVNDESSVPTEFLGMPLEKDTELPVSLFFATKPLLYLSGYGLKNGGFVAPKYYIFNEEGFKKVGSMSYALDLRWYYFTCEFGIIIFFVWLCYFTKKFDPSTVTPFENKYYAFLFVFLFFNGIELMIIMVYSVYKGSSHFKKMLGQVAQRP